MACRYTSGDTDSHSRAAPGISLSQWTQTFWVRLRGDTNAIQLFGSLIDNVPGPRYMYGGTDATGTAMVCGSSEGASATVQEMGIDTWYFVKLTYASNTLTMSVCAAGGSSFGTPQTKASLTDLPAVDALLIGGAGAYWLNGEIASYKCWTGVTLNDTQALAERHWLNAQVAGGLLWNYKYVSGALETDSSGNSLTLSVESGSPAWAADPVDIYGTDPLSGVLVNQNFEGAGFDNGETWYNYEGDTGAADPDYTTLALKGSSSLYMKDDDDEGTYALTDYADVGEGTIPTYVHMRFRVLDYPSGATYGFAEIFKMYELRTLLDWNAHEVFFIFPDGKVSIHPAYGAEVAKSDDALALDTTYHIWLYVTRTTMADGSGWMKVSETPTIPGANFLEWSGLDISAVPNVKRIVPNGFGFGMLHSEGYEYIADEVIVSAEAIGSLPTGASLLVHAHRQRMMNG